MKRVMVNIAEDLSEEEFCREFWASLDETYEEWCTHYGTSTPDFENRGIGASGAPGNGRSERWAPKART